MCEMHGYLMSVKKRIMWLQPLNTRCFTYAAHARCVCRDTPYPPAAVSCNAVCKLRGQSQPWPGRLTRCSPALDVTPTKQHRNGTQAVRGSGDQAHVQREAPPAGLAACSDQPVCMHLKLIVQVLATILVQLVMGPDPAGAELFCRAALPIM